MEHPKKRVEMEKAGQPTQISDFDYEHFCNGNPLDCYCYRKAINEKTRGKEPKQRF
jgi:hypothetical protein